MSATLRVVKPVTVTTWDGVKQSTGKEHPFGSWDELLKALAKDVDKPFRGDKDQPGWSPARFRGARRSLDGVLDVGALVLDYDDGTGLDVIADTWSGHLGLIHTTRRHKPDAPRARVVLPLSRPVTADEYSALWRWAYDRTESEIDKACSDPSRFWYVPGTAEGYGPGEARELSGVPLDPDEVLAEQPEPEPVEPPRAPADRMLRARAYVDTMDPAVSGAGGHQATWRVALACAQGFDLDEPDTLAVLRHYNCRCQPPWNERELRHKAHEATEKARGVPRGYLLEQRPAEPAGPAAPAVDWQAAARDALAKAKAPAPLVRLGVEDIFAPLPPVPWLVQPLDLCPGAPALVAGYGFSRKTIAVQSMGVEIAAGLRVWDAFGARQGRVLHVDYEQGRRLTLERYQRLAAAHGLSAADLDGRLEVVVMPPLYLDDRAAEEQLVRECDGIDLLIVDSLRAACPTVEENSSDARRVLDVLGRVSEKTGTVALVIHHARKPNQDKAGGAKMAIRGSGAIFDACSSVLVFEAEKDKPTRVSHEKARTSGITAEDFELTTDDLEIDGNPRGGLVVTARSPVELDPAVVAQGALDALKARILDHVREQGGEVASKNSVYQRLKGDRSRFYAAVDELLMTGALVETDAPRGGAKRLRIA